MHDENLKSDAVVEAVKDVKQLGLIASIASLSYVFWVVGGMEMVERLAYYAVRSVAGLYATAAESQGGLGITPTQFATILTVWTIVQNVVPVLTGGLSDRYGYKETIFVSTVLKMAAYVIMAVFPSYAGFFVGAVVLAFGTGIFKPGIQGTLVHATDRTNSSMAWGIFYQTVNIGGAIAPMVAGFFRQMDWQFVFIACAVIIAFNFILLLTYKEVGKEERLARAEAGDQGNLFFDALRELKRPVLLLYLVIFSGFWFMFMSLFDVLPLHIRDWVDTSVIVQSIWGSGQPGGVMSTVLVLDQDGTRVLPEGLVNINALMIMFTCFIFAWLSSKLKALTSITMGTLFCSGALIAIGGFNFAWFVALAIMIFSIGEMISSPKFSEYLGNMAPRDKTAMYLGFSQLPLAIGASLEAYFGPRMYGAWADKDQISRSYLEENGWTTEQVGAVPIGEAFQTAVDVSGTTALELQQIMYQANDIGLVWYVMGFVGVLSAFGMALYANWLKRIHSAV